MNRGYKGKSTEVDNECDLDMLLETRRQMGDKPVIACVSMVGPMVMAEFEEAADAILTTFGNLPPGTAGDYQRKKRTFWIASFTDSREHGYGRRAIRRCSF